MLPALVLMLDGAVKCILSCVPWVRKVEMGKQQREGQGTRGGSGPPVWASVLRQLTHPLAFFGLALLVMLWFCLKTFDRCKEPEQALIVFTVGACVFVVFVVGVFVLVWFKPMHLMLERQKVIDESVLEVERYKRTTKEAIKQLHQASKALGKGGELSGDLGTRLDWVLSILRGDA